MSPDGGSSPMPTDYRSSNNFSTSLTTFPSILYEKITNPYQVILIISAWVNLDVSSPVEKSAQKLQSVLRPEDLYSIEIDRRRLCV